MDRRSDRRSASIFINSDSALKWKLSVQQSILAVGISPRVRDGAAAYAAKPPPAIAPGSCSLRPQSRDWKLEEDSFQKGENAISEDDCSGDILNVDAKSAFPSQLSLNQINALGVEASVRSCHVIGKILKRVYQKRRISTKLAQEIADECKFWPQKLSPMLHWGQAASAHPSQGIAILHVNLLYCHSIILLTRPFFLYLLNSEIQKDRSSNGKRPHRLGSRMERFSEACVTASTHTVALVQNAYEGQYLQRRNPFVM